MIFFARKCVYCLMADGFGKKVSSEARHRSIFDYNANGIPE